MEQHVVSGRVAKLDVVSLLELIVAHVVNPFAIELCS